MIPLGLPADMIQKALTDFGILEFEDRCPVYHWKWNSAINPLDITFKMDEEMEYFDKFANENTKIVSTQSGNKLVTTTKNSYGTWITTTTFNNTFAIMVKKSKDNVQSFPWMILMIFLIVCLYRNVPWLDLIWLPWFLFWKKCSSI